MSINIKKFFSMSISFMFFVVPVASHAMDAVDNQCLICMHSVPEDSKDKIETSCHHEFCRDCLLDWWTNKKKETEEGGWEFMPQCPKCKTYQSLDLYEKAKICPICLDNKELVTTNCKHKFCKDCFGKWIKINNNCPYCRREEPTLIEDVQNVKQSFPRREIAGSSNEEVCPICLVGIGSSELITTACRHKFHKECLNKWVEVSPHENCPVCRKRIGAGRNSASDSPSLARSGVNRLRARHDQRDVWKKLDLDDVAILGQCSGIIYLIAMNEFGDSEEVDINSDVPPTADSFDNYSNLVNTEA